MAQFRREAFLHDKYCRLVVRMTKFMGRSRSCSQSCKRWYSFLVERIRYAHHFRLSGLPRDVEVCQRLETHANGKWVLAPCRTRLGYVQKLIRHRVGLRLASTTVPNDTRPKENKKTGLRPSHSSSILPISLA